MDAILNWIVANPIPVIIIVVVLFLIFTYNNLNAKKKRVEKSFSTIDVYLEKRFDEIGSLLEQTMSSYEHEESIYSQVAALRSGIETAKTGSINDKVRAMNGITSFVANPGFKTEAYPELGQAIVQLGRFTAEKTSQVEDDLAAARKQYNNNVTAYNTKISSFPTNLVAGIFGFKTPFELFKVSEGKKERPTMATVAKNKKEVLEQQLEMEQMKLEAEIKKQKTLKEAELEMKTMDDKQQTEVVDTLENNETNLDDNKTV